MTTTYERMRNLLAEWEREKPLETALKGLSTVFGVNQEPKQVAEAIEEIAVRGNEFSEVLAINCVIALWVSRPFNVDGANQIATLLEALTNQRLVERVEFIFPVSIRTSLPGFMPNASERINQLEVLLNNRTLPLGQSERLLAMELARFLRVRRHRYQ
jgi:hypothetical protein